MCMHKCWNLWALSPIGSKAAVELKDLMHLKIPFT